MRKKQTVSLKKLQIHGKVILAVLEVMKKQNFCIFRTSR